MYHYVNPDGSRYKQSNVGTDDAAKLILGALVARQYFNDPAVTSLVHGIYAAINWQAWIDPKKKQCYEAWAPETGFSHSEWGRYSEGPLQIYLLGLGSSTPGYAFTVENWNAWTRGPTNTYGNNPTYKWIGASPALFTHQYPQAFFYLRGLTDNSSAGGGISYWDNLTQATLAQWQWCQDLGRAAVKRGRPISALGGQSLGPHGNRFALRLLQHVGRPGALQAATGRNAYSCSGSRFAPVYADPKPPDVEIHQKTLSAGLDAVWVRRGLQPGDGLGGPATLDQSHRPNVAHG